MIRLLLYSGYSRDYYLGCLCIIPKYQRKNVGTQAVKYMLGYYTDWRKVTLITPLYKEMWIHNRWYRYGWKCKSSTFANGTIKF